MSKSKKNTTTITINNEIYKKLLNIKVEIKELDDNTGKRKSFNDVIEKLLIFYERGEK